MSRTPQPSRLNLTALAQGEQVLTGSTPLAELARLAADVPPEAAPAGDIGWQVRAEFRARPGASDQLWLHLEAHAEVPLSCQRCLAPAVHTLEVDRWFRFVESEAVAEAEDDESEEDLLVLEPQFDLLALLEDELLMSLPLVPMHAHCPSQPVFRAGEDVAPAQAQPNPFAALAQLKKKAD